MTLNEIITSIMSSFALLVSIYAAFVNPKFQLSLHVMNVIAAKAKEANSYWGRERVSNKNHIAETITSVIRTIQLIDKIQSDHKFHLRGLHDTFLTYFYLELFDSIHNTFMADPKKIAEELFPNQDDKGKEIICDQLTTIRNHFRTIHERYTGKGF